MSSEIIKYLLDTHAWIEYFIGSKEGKIVKNLINQKNVSTSVISIAELSDKYYKEGLVKEWEKRYHFIINKSNILPLSLNIARKAGLSKLELRKNDKSVGLADSIIYETAKEYELIVVTGDPHFEKLKDVLFLS